MAEAPRDSSAADARAEQTNDWVAWRTHLRFLGVTGLPVLCLAAYMLVSALTDTSEMAVGVFIYGFGLAVLWAIFAAGASALFAWLRRFGVGPVILGYVLALVPVGLLISGLIR